MGGAGKDKRAAPRRRTRLRSGKLLTPDGRFVVDGLMHDVSACGARLRLLTNADVPTEIRFHDENGSSIREAVVVWRRGLEIGIRFRSAATPTGDPPPPAPEVIVRVVYR
jgi:hypothetical protein